MKYLLSTLLCVTLFTASLVGIDHLFVTVSADFPGYSEMREFYLDFRSRLVAVSRGEEDGPIEKVIATEKKVPQGGAPKDNVKKASVYSPGYVYADGGGVLRFADTLEEIPPKYRKDAQPLKK